MPGRTCWPTARQMRPWPESLLRVLKDASPVESAQALLGCMLLGPEGRLSRIVETEAYGGQDDLGSHACKGPKPKCRTMFGPPGRAYVYLSYGCHWMLNVVCCEEGRGSAVLMRAAEPLEGLDYMKANRGPMIAERDLLRGPGRLAQAYGLTGADDWPGSLCWRRQSHSASAGNISWSNPCLKTSRTHFRPGR